MRFRSAAMISVAVGALGLGLAAVAQPPAEPRDPNKSGYKPASENQMRGPVPSTATQYEVKEVVASGIDTPFAVEFLPGGKYLITERMLGQFRIADKDGKVSPPIKDGVPAVAANRQG